MRCDRDRLCDSLTLLSLGATLGPTMNLAKRKLGLMVSTGPEHANLDTAVGLGRAALDRGAEVYLYLIDDGVTPVDVVLTGPAVHLLDEDTDDLVDGDDIAKFRASLKKLGIPFLVEVGAAPPDPSWNADGHPVRPITAEEIAALIPRAERFVIF